MNKFLLLLLIILTLISCTSVDLEKDDNFKKSIKEADQYLSNYINDEIDKKAEYHFINGLTYQLKNQWALSVIDFNQALRYDSSAAILYSLAKSYSQIERYNLALETLLKSIEQNDKFIPSLEMLTEIYISMNDFENAINIYEKILDIENSVFRKQQLAYLYEQVNPEKSLKLYESLYEETGDKFLIKKLSDFYSKNLNHPKNEFFLEKIYFENPSNSHNALRLFDLYLAKNNYDKALDLLNTIDKNIETEKLDMFYGTIGYQMLSDTINLKKEISDYLNKIDNRFYFDWKIQLLSGYLMCKIDKCNQSESRFINYIKLNPEDKKIPLQISFYLLENEMDQICTNFLEKVISIQGESSELLFFLGLSHLTKNEKLAIEHFHKSIILDSTFVDPLVQLGIYYDGKSEFEESYRYYSKVLEKDPENALVNNNFAYSLSVRNQNLEKAKKMSEVALKAFPNNSSYLDTYAWINYRLGNYSEALKYILKSIDNGGMNAEVYEHLGDILYKLDRYDEAREAYRNALRLEPLRNSVLNSIKLMD